MVVRWEFSLFQGGEGVRSSIASEVGSGSVAWGSARRRLFQGGNAVLTLARAFHEDMDAILNLAEAVKDFHLPVAERSQILNCLFKFLLIRHRIFPGCQR